MLPMARRDCISGTCFFVCLISFRFSLFFVFPQSKQNVVCSQNERRRKRTTTTTTTMNATIKNEKRKHDNLTASE